MCTKTLFGQDKGTSWSGVATTPYSKLWNLLWRLGQAKKFAFHICIRSLELFMTEADKESEMSLSYWKKHFSSFHKIMADCRHILERTGNAHHTQTNLDLLQQWNRNWQLENISRKRSTYFLSSYCFNSILSTRSRVREKVVCRSILNFLEKHKSLNEKKNNTFRNSLRISFLCYSFIAQTSWPSSINTDPP